MDEHTYIAYGAGKSGGHMIPCLTLFERAKKAHPHLRALFFTTTSPLDKKIVSSDRCDGVIVRLPLHSTLKNPFRILSIIYGLIIACLQSMRYLMYYRPTRIVTTGGIVGVPVCVAGYILGIPIDLYELNAVVGKANRVLASLATQIMISFPEAQRSLRSRSCTLVPYPIRFMPAEPLHKARIRASLGLAEHTPTVLVLGGSQGSVQLNQFVKQALQQYTKPLQVIHQTGSNDHHDWAAWYLTRGIHALVFPYHDDLAPYLNAADLIICRAGAGTLFECMAFKKKMIVIPLEGVADNHQVANAYACQRSYTDAITLRVERLTAHASLLIGTIDTYLYPQHAVTLHEYTHTMR